MIRTWSLLVGSFQGHSQIPPTLSRTMWASQGLRKHLTSSCCQAGDPENAHTQEGGECSLKKTLEHPVGIPNGGNFQTVSGDSMLCSWGGKSCTSGCRPPPSEDH